MISKELIQKLRWEMEGKTEYSHRFHLSYNELKALLDAAEECERLKEEVERFSKLGIDDFCHQCDRMHSDGHQCY